MKRTTLPPSLAPCFQEYLFEALDIDSDRELIIERTLNLGNLAEARWLISAYGRAEVREWIESRSAARLTRRRRVLWTTLLDCSEAEEIRQASSIWPH